MKTLKLKTLVATLAALAAGSAHAAIITQWTVGVDAVFLPLTVVDSNNITGAAPGNPSSGVTISNSDTRLRWGTNIGNGQSGLDITNSPTSATVNTGINVVLPPVANITVTHTNQPITGTTLDKVTLSSTLTLTPLVPALPGLPSQTLNFLIDYLETPNTPAVGNTCADGGANGVGVNINGCADIFVIDKTALNFSFSYDTDGPGGDPTQQYFISFLELTGGLNPLPTAACLSVTGSSAPCLGFETPEGANTPFKFGSVITTRPVQITVPEPGMLGLLGLGLATMGLVLRRKV